MPRSGSLFLTTFSSLAFPLKFLIFPNIWNIPKIILAFQCFSPWMGNSHIAFNFRLSFHVIFICPIQVIFCILWLLLPVRVYLSLWPAPNIFCCDKRCGFPIVHFAPSLFFVTLDMACTLAPCAPWVVAWLHIEKRSQLDCFHHGLLNFTCYTYTFANHFKILFVSIWKSYILDII